MADPGAGGDRRRARRTTQGPVGGPHPDQGGNRRAEPRAAARRAHRVDEPAGDRRREELRPALGGGAPRADEPAEGHARRMVRPRRGAVRTAPPERKGRVVGSRCIVRSLAHRQGVGAPACNRSQPAGAIGATFALTQAPINPNKFRIRSTPPPGPALVRPCRSIRTIRMSRHGRRAGKTTSPGLLRYAPCSRTSSS